MSYDADTLEAAAFFLVSVFALLAAVGTTVSVAANALQWWVGGSFTLVWLLVAGLAADEID